LSPPFGATPPWGRPLQGGLAGACKNPPSMEVPCLVLLCSVLSCVECACMCLHFKPSKGVSQHHQHKRFALPCLALPCLALPCLACLWRASPCLWLGLPCLWLALSLACLVFGLPCLALSWTFLAPLQGGLSVCCPYILSYPCS
jgi:hypothetical protein